ncbi:precorrin-3B C(17)-methyltransferase [Chamaesiphon minutus]|uniref:Precorrin-3B C17-methyltransferase n=1 Tax=Chamaesiphon minutus (strain ATCC 27169 / PCC 6605) TaxID=1173020 RepID=K9UB35_CHAP6|nr:precorrin-3B C(17)-methyltransferase [Chamaesiphon minutus]AFY91651.1 precorrin-3B C17-methyltransferase [Chamaesiphon minutus PCC 6605]
MLDSHSERLPVASVVVGEACALRLLRQRTTPAVVVLNQISVPTARKLMTALPGAQLYGLVGRTTDVDVSFANFGDTLRQFYSQGVPIIGLCAAGILIRTLAPVLTDSKTEPPVVSVAADGSAVVPLLGGMTGVNDLAERIAAVLDVQPAITTTGKLQFNTVLPDPPAGYRLANPQHVKAFIADLIAGVSVSLDGDAEWLTASEIPFCAQGERQITITTQAISGSPTQLVYHPTSLVLAVVQPSQFSIAGWIEVILDRLTTANLALAAVACIVLPKTPAGAAIAGIGTSLNLPIRLVESAIEHPDLTVVSSDRNLTIFSATQPIEPHAIGQDRGKITVIGTGPGSPQWMSPQVRQTILAATDIVGYHTYLALVKDLTVGKQCHGSDNRVELDRSKLALDLAASGKNVVVVSSGDPGIFAMAAAVLEVLDKEAKPEWQTIDLQVAPGISAMQAAAAAVGAPLGHDFCAISLSDILKPWEVVASRIASAAESDFAIAFYNPISSQRTWQLTAAKEILLKTRSGTTPVILARNLGRPGQEVKVITLGELAPESADMRTVILIGSSQTKLIPRADGNNWVYTPRSY